MGLRITPDNYERLRQAAFDKGFGTWFIEAYGDTLPAAGQPRTQPGHFSKTETLRRLRVLAAAARIEYRQPRNAVAEVGLRCRPVVFDNLRFAGPLIDPNDDLSDTVSLVDAAYDDTVSVFGAVVHIYITSRGWDGELEGVGIGWMGTPTDAPEWLG